MQTKITGFRQDEEAHWVAELQCGHTQHMRHAPPWQERAWVLSMQGRASKLGQAIECPLCDMPVLPAHVREYKRTAVFTEQTIPTGLLNEHTTKADVWARIVVTAGELDYSFGAPQRTFVLDSDHVGIVKPQVPHRVQPRGLVRFHVEFWR
jgi:tellurite methyltransferase